MTVAFQEILPEQNTYRNLVVDLTHRCNMECNNCYIPNRDIPDMDAGKLMAFLSRLPSTTYIRLIGAEPTMREDLPDIIRGVRRQGHKPILVTNGLKLAHLEYCQELREAGLSTVLMSMNGAANDDFYRKVDGGKYARLKTRALRNIFRCRFIVNTGTILVRGVNEEVVPQQIGEVLSAAREAGVEFSETRPWNVFSPVLRIKSIGRIGRCMEESPFNLEELVTRSLGLDMGEARYIKSGYNFIEFSDSPTNAKLLSYDTDLGPILLRLIDWTVDEHGIPSPENQDRGRVTPRWKIAPFFEHVKANEFNY